MKNRSLKLNCISNPLVYDISPRVHSETEMFHTHTHTVTHTQSHTVTQIHSHTIPHTLTQLHTHTHTLLHRFTHTPFHTHSQLHTHSYTVTHTHSPTDELTLLLLANLEKILSEDMDFPEYRWVSIFEHLGIYWDLCTNTGGLQIAS